MQLDNGFAAVPAVLGATPRLAGISHSVDVTTAPVRSPRDTSSSVVVSEALLDEAEALSELVALMRSDAIKRPLVVASRYGMRIAEMFEDGVGVVATDRHATRGSAHRLAKATHSAGADAVVAIGGGRCLDVAKLAAALAAVPLVAVPTQLSHDGICSPVAVLPRRPGGLTESSAAVAPRIAFFSIPTLVRSPGAATRAGLGDLFSNPLALADWELATKAGADRIEGAAYEASMRSFELIEPLLSRPLLAEDQGPGLISVLAEAIAASGSAMAMAGTSRPASGAEHKVSHAIDELYGARGRHGEQVAFACLLVAPLHGLDPYPLRDKLINVGLPHHPRQFALSAGDLVRVLLRAPATRPGRFTVLEHVRMDARDAAHLVRWVWPDVC